MLRGLCASVCAGWDLVEPAPGAAQASVTDSAPGKGAAGGALPARGSETLVADALMA